MDRDPLILFLGEGEAFPTRLAEAIGRKFGVAAMDIGPGPVKPSLGDWAGGERDWGRIRLVMIYHHLRSGTAMERCKRLIEEEACPLPILLAGTEEEAELKRNRAAMVGAVDYLAIEPFHVLTVLKTLDQTLKLFA